MKFPACTKLRGSVFWVQIGVPNSASWMERMVAERCSAHWVRSFPPLYFP